MMIQTRAKIHGGASRLALFALATAFIAGSSIATPPQNPQVVNMTLTGPPPGPSLDGVYTDPYTATTQATNKFFQPTGPTSQISIICDDFSTEVTLNQNWNA